MQTGAKEDQTSVLANLRSRFGRRAIGRWLVKKGAALMHPERPQAAYVAARYGMCARLPSDIQEHIATLCKYSQQCGSIAELGVRGMVSTWAFVSGLISSTDPVKRLTCLDIEPIPHAKELADICRSQNIDLHILQADSATAEIPACDLLFIDTWHIAGHLKRELQQHSPKARKFIILHDTTTDGEQSEALRSGADIPALARQTGYSEEEIRQGLMFAVRDFLHTHPDWKIAEHFTNNNGLLVLSRNQRG